LRGTGALLSTSCTTAPVQEIDVVAGAPVFRSILVLAGAERDFGFVSTEQVPLGCPRIGLSQVRQVGGFRRVSVETRPLCSGHWIGTIKDKR
jgi:hypothetical protein